MRFVDFDPGTLAQGLCHRLYLELGPSLDGQPFGVPLLAVRGGSGPTLVVLAGVHGDEFEGVAAIHELFRRLEPERLRGTLLGRPHAQSAGGSGRAPFQPGRPP